MDARWTHGRHDRAMMPMRALVASITLTTVAATAAGATVLRATTPPSTALSSRDQQWRSRLPPASADDRVEHDQGHRRDAGVREGRGERYGADRRSRRSAHDRCRLRGPEPQDVRRHRRYAGRTVAGRNHRAGIATVDGTTARRRSRRGRRRASAPQAVSRCATARAVCTSPPTCSVGSQPTRA